MATVSGQPGEVLPVNENYRIDSDHKSFGKVKFGHCLLEDR